MDAQVEWRVLGDVEVVIDGAPVELSGRRVPAVLGYLLLNASRPVTVDRLVDALWGERPPATARNSIQRFVADLRRALGPAAPALATVADGYRLEVAPGSLDLQRAERSASLARAAESNGDLDAAVDSWRSVLEEWRGEALSGVVDTDYADAERVRLAELRAVAVEHLVAVELERHRHDSIIDLVEEHASAHPTRDRAWELLMLARYRSGRQVEALAAYDVLRRTLAEELGVGPSPDIEALRVAILDHAVAPSAALATGRRRRSTDRPSGEAPALPFPVQLVGRGVAPIAGRERELAVIGTAVDEARTRVGMVFIGGEPGQGKSRCAAEAAGVAHAAGATVLYGRCTAGLTSDYQPWRGVLAHALGHSPAELLDRHVGMFGSALFALAGVPLDGSTVSAHGAGDLDTASISRSTTALLERLAAHGPLLIVLDDLQSVDVASLRMLRHVVDHAAGPIVVVGLYRVDEVGAGHELAQHIATAPADADMQVLELAGLDHDAVRSVAAVVTGIGGPEISTGAVESLRDLTDGNPYFLIETLRSVDANELLGEAWSDDVRLAVPSNVRRLLVERVERLGSPTATSLRLASSIGREFDLTVLAQALGNDPLHVLTHVESAVAAHLVDDSPDGRDRFAFAHDLVHQALAEDQSESRRCRAHGAIADAMEKVYASRLDQHAEEIATQLLRADHDDDVERTFSYCRRAGVAALARYATDDAIRWFRRALDLLHRAGTSDPWLEADVLVQLGSAEKIAARGGQSDTLLRAGRLALESGNHDALVESVIRNRDSFNGAGWTLDRERIEMARAALDVVGDADSPQRASVLAALCHAMWEVEHAAEVKPLYEELVALARRLGDPLRLATALDTALSARNYSASRADLAAYAQQLRELYPTVALDPNEFVGALSALATTALQLADAELLDHALGAIDDAAERTGLPAAVNGRHRADAMRAWFAGDIGAYVRCVTEGFEFSSQFEGSDVATLVFRGQMFFGMWAQGREGELLDVDVLVPGRPATRPLYRVIQALAHIATDHIDGANAILSAELAAGFWPNDNHWTMQSSTMWADAAVQLERRDVCEAMLENLGPSTGSVAGQFMSPFEPVDTSLGRMCVVLGRFDDAATHLDRAGAIAESFGAGWMSARVDLGRLELALAAGDAERATSLAASLGDLASALGYGSISRRLGALTPAVR